MGRSYDIAEFNLSDGLTPRQVEKLNSNFRRLISMMVNEDAGLDKAITDLDFPLSVDKGGTGTYQFPINSIITGNGGNPLTHVSTQKGFLYADSANSQAYWRDEEFGNSNWFGNGAPVGSLDPSSEWSSSQYSDHEGDLYLDTANGNLYYWMRTGTPPTWQWNLFPISGGGGSSTYASLPDKPTITEEDQGIYVNQLGYNEFGPLGTFTTQTIQQDHDWEYYLDEPFTTTELDVIIQMAERAGAI